MQVFDSEVQNAFDAFYPVNHTSWAIVSSEGVVSRIHLDTAGLATASFILTGSKYWAVAEPCVDKQVELEITRTDVWSSIRDEEVAPRSRWEAVTLTRGDVL